METKILNLRKASLQMGKNFGALSHVVAWLSTQRTLPFEIFAHGIPYEANRTYGVMRSEFECSRAAAQFEIQRQTLRGF
jgi:hypothetical protein